MSSHRIDAMHQAAGGPVERGRLWRQRLAGIVLGGLAGTAAAFSPDAWHALWDAGVTTPAERTAVGDEAAASIPIPAPDAAESARQFAHTLMMRARELIAHGEIRDAERFLAAAEKLEPESDALADTRRLLDYAKARLELAKIAPASGPREERADAERRTPGEPSHPADEFATGVKEFRSANYDAALAAFGQAAAAGHAPAQNYLGYMYRHGLGVTQDFARALSWYRKAAAQNHAGAMNNIGYMYRHGLGIDRDDAAARGWFKRAAERGDAAGQYNLGQMLADGVGGEPDYRLALTWYKAAAEQGHGQAAMELARLYAEGLGAAADAAEAYFWSGVAARERVDGALPLRTALGAKLSTAQRQAADARLGRWKTQSADRPTQ